MMKQTFYPNLGHQVQLICHFQIQAQRQIEDFGALLQHTLYFQDTYIWKTINEVVYVGVPGCLYDLTHRNFSAVVPIGNVVSDAGVEENRFLGYKAHLRSQPPDVQVRNHLPIQGLKIQWTPVGERPMDQVRDNVGVRILWSRSWNSATVLHGCVFFIQIRAIALFLPTMMIIIPRDQGPVHWFPPFSIRILFLPTISLWILFGSLGLRPSHLSLVFTTPSCRLSWNQRPRLIPSLMAPCIHSIAQQQPRAAPGLRAPLTTPPLVLQALLTTTLSHTHSLMRGPPGVCPPTHTHHPSASTAGPYSR